MWLVPRDEKILARRASGLLMVLVVSLLSPSFAVPNIVGEPPAFVSQQEDVVVSAEVLVPVSGAPDNSANLVLLCQVTGTPTPTIAWFREGSPVGAEFVNSDGTLAMNITEPEQATASGTTYYCLATNAIGSSLPAIARSRDVTVTLNFFNGFVTTGRVDVPTVLGGSVALECDYGDAKPSPEVEWFMNNGSMKIEEVPEQNLLLFLEGGRYLFIRTLTDTQRSAFFHCEVVNAYLGTDPQRSSTTYYLSEDLPVDDLRVYRTVREMTAIPGETETVVYVAALATTGGVEAPLVLSCDIDTSDVVVSIVNDVVATFTGLDGTETNREATVNCQVVGITPPLAQAFTFLISQPTAITSTVTAPAPAGGAESLVDRDRLVGGGPVSYMCVFEGIPTPTVTWYFNGETIPTDSGISENGNQVVIAAPLVVHSGVYQCVVSNVIDGVVQEDRRAWVVEVREPKAPTVESLLNVNPFAVEDRVEGTVIVSELGTPNLTIMASVSSDPCPSVQWTFAGMNITDDSAEYSFDNPCLGSSPSTSFIFILTIGNLTSATSGRYGAVFSHFTSVNLPELFVTIPVPVQVKSLDRKVVTTLDEEPTCLLLGSDVVLTCSIIGFPRPMIFFRKQTQVIVPGMGDFERISNISYDQIRIADVQMSDEGQYTCEARIDSTTIILLNPTPNSQQFCTIPNIVSAVFDPSKEVKPIIAVGEELKLICNVTGTPLPTVTWTKDGDPLVGTPQLFISSSPEGVALITINPVALDNNGRYTCLATNNAGQVERSFQVDQISMTNNPLLPTSAIIGIAAGGVGLILVVVLLILLLVCVYLCAKKGKSASANFSYDYSAKEGGDGRGNVDTDSFDGGGQPEAFDPDYDSVPTRRPNEPPPYKATPGYAHGAPLAGDDVEMMKYPPQDTESYVTGAPSYSRPAHDNGYRQQTPNADDFLSEDAQFV